MADFEQALKYILDNEGGLVSNPVDRGGATHYGISTPTYSNYLGRPATVDDIKNMPMGHVRTIYKGYWNAVKGDQIKEQSTATYLMDMGVLMGPAAAIKLAQSSLNLKADGIIGPISLAKLNFVQPSVFALVFSKACVKAFATIVVKNSSQLVFLSQWINRAFEMTDFAV